MEGNIEKYKLAWIEGDKLKSLFFADIKSAKKEANNLDNFYYIMELDHKSGTYYSWKLIDGPYNFYLFHWQKLLAGSIFVLFILFFIILILIFKK